MRSIRKIKTSADQRYRRHLRVRKKVDGTPDRPRLVVFRSSKHIYAQLVDDERGLTIAGVADTSEGMQIEGKGKVARSFAVDVDRKSTRLNSSHGYISYAVFCLKKKKTVDLPLTARPTCVVGSTL